MTTIKIGVLSRIPNLLNELKLKLPMGQFTLKDIFTNNMETNARATSPSDLQNVHIVIADFDLLGPHLYELDHLKFVQGTWAGIDALMPYIKQEVKPSVPIYRFSGQHFGRIISEYIVSMIINHERSFFEMRENQLKKLWVKEGKFQNYRTIYDLTIGVMGVGHIGSVVMSTLKMFGAKVKALGRRDSINKEEFSYVDEYFSTKDIPGFLNGCDYIVNALPNTNETKGMLNYPILEVCKDKNPVFINIGRGSIISDESLIEALDKNWFSHAYLDVFNKEPLPEDSPLWSSPKVFVSPHVAANSRPQDIAVQFEENFKLFETNAVVPSLLDFSRGY